MGRRRTNTGTRTRFSTRVSSKNNNTALNEIQEKVEPSEESKNLVTNNSEAPNNNKLKRKNLGSSNKALKTKKVKEITNKGEIVFQSAIIGTVSLLLNYYNCIINS